MEFHGIKGTYGLPWGLLCSSLSEASACNMGETWVQFPGREVPLEKEMATTPVFLPGESHGQRSIAGYGSWDRKSQTRLCCTQESDTTFLSFHGLPRRLSGKEPACQSRRHRCNIWVGKIPWSGKWQSTPVFLPARSHGWGGAWWGTVNGVPESVTNKQLSTYDTKTWGLYVYWQPTPRSDLPPAAALMNSLPIYTGNTPSLHRAERLFWLAA